MDGVNATREIIRLSPDDLSRVGQDQNFFFGYTKTAKTPSANRSWGGDSGRLV